MVRRRVDRSRRQLLAAVGGLALALTGCLGDGAGDSDGESMADHAATDGIDEAPHLGPAPTDAETVVLAFEDPSCSSCATVARETLPELRERAIEPGTTSYVWRASPGVEPWGEPATRALVAVFRQEPDAFWTLKERYYSAQDSIDEDVVVDRTRDLLADGLDVDEGPVLEAMAGDSDDVDEYVRRDEAAASGADVEVIPSFVLFRAGEYVTTVVGPQSYEVFEGALEL